MSKKDNMADVDNMEIEPLSDDLLESVAGGNSNAAGCSCQLCSYTCPPKERKEIAQ